MWLKIPPFFVFFSAVWNKCRNSEASLKQLPLSLYLLTQPIHHPYICLLLLQQRKSQCIIHDFVTFMQYKKNNNFPPEQCICIMTECKLFVEVKPESCFFVFFILIVYMLYCFTTSSACMHCKQTLIH